MDSKALKKVGRHRAVEIPHAPVFRGNFSKVFFGRFDNKDVAVKRVECFDFKTDELENLRKFQHANIVRYLFADQDSEYHYIVLEKCDCTLREFVNDERQKIPHLHILWQVTCGLAYLHEKHNLIHRDLKPCNILLIFYDDAWIAKIADFDISKTLNPDNTRVTQTTIRGTVGYKAPETLKGEKISKRTDIFSLGVIFFYVLTEGKHPYGPDNLRIESDIRDGTVSPNLAGLLPDFEHDATALISSMIAYQPDVRPVINEILAHHIFWEADKKLSYIQEVSDYCIAGSNSSIMQPILEGKKEDIVGDWRKTLSDISPIVKEVFEGMKTKKQKDGVCDLLRNIRNLKNHYNEKPLEFREVLGKMPDGLAKFFTQLFPKLLPYVYETMKCRKEEFSFEKYYQYKCQPGIDVTPVGPSFRPEPPEEFLSNLNLSGIEHMNWDRVGKKQVLLIGPKIGEGTRSQVFKGVFHDQHVAVKSMLFDGSLTEVEILRKLDNPYVIRVHYADENEKILYMALDLCTYTLTQYVTRSFYVKMQPIEVLRQITTGLDYLHNGRTFCIVHRNLKPSNILFQFIELENTWRVKITDLGIRNEFVSANTRSAKKENEGYVAPELLDRPDGSKGTGKIGKETDIFSLGVIFYYVLSEGKHPFSNDFRNVNEMIRDSEPILDSIQEEYNDDAELLILSMIKKDYKQRISIGEVKSHAIFWSADQKVEFLQKVSNFLEDRKVNKSLLEELEKLKPTICGRNWGTQIARDNPAIEKVMKKRKMIGHTSLQLLLRAIRNWSSHYHDPQTPDSFKKELGSLPDGFIAFFSKQFPKLVPEVYHFMRQLKHEEQFQKCYGIKTIAEDNPEVELMMDEDLQMEIASEPEGAVAGIQRNIDDMRDLEGIVESPIEAIREEEEKRIVRRKPLNDEQMPGHQIQEAWKWKILCGHCFSYVTQGDKIRHIKNQHRFVVDKGFPDRVIREPCRPLPNAPGFLGEKFANFKCANISCLNYLGEEMQHKGRTYPTLTVEQLVFEDNLGKRATVKQWSMCPFVVDDEEELDETRIKELAL